MVPNTIPFSAGGVSPPWGPAPTGLGDVTGSPLIFALAAVVPIAGPVAVAMYRRLVRGRVLASPTRRAVLAHVARAPGVTAARVAHALNVDYKTVQHHVRVLHEFGYVHARRDGRTIRYHAIRARLTEGPAH